VSSQGQARKALRTAGGPCLPSALLSSLRSIPQEADLPGPPPGLAISADGQLVSMLRPEPGFRSEIATPTHHAVPRPPASRPTPSHRMLRVGTGVATAGLALGALVFGAAQPAPSAPAAPTAPTPVAGLPSGSVFGGAPVSPNVVDAQLRLGTAGPAPAVRRTVDR
jgi:hypothetical protein